MCFVQEEFAGPHGPAGCRIFWKAGPCSGKLVNGCRLMLITDVRQYRDSRTVLLQPTESYRQSKQRLGTATLAQIEGAWLGGQCHFTEWT